MTQTYDLTLSVMPMLNPYYYMAPFTIITYQFEGAAPISSLSISHNNSQYDSISEALELKDQLRVPKDWPGSH